MTDQELRKLSRKDLLELLVAQGRERDALQAELEKAKAALVDRQLRIEQSGSIAEAALQVNGVFYAAQEAAEQYLENIRLRSEQLDAVCVQREKESKEKADRQLQEAARAAHQIEEDAKRRCQEMENAVLRKPQTPEMLLEEKQLREQLYSAVMTLPKKQARRIYARYYLGMTVNEIAGAEGVDPSLVRDSIRRGLKRLAKYF